MAHVSLPGDQIIVPREPKLGTPEHDQWANAFGDCNGIKEEVYPEGTYFFSPFDYERQDVDISSNGTREGDCPAGSSWDRDQEIRYAARSRPGACRPKAQPTWPAAAGAAPGRYNEYANPYAYEIKLVPPLTIDPGFRGVVTIVAGKPAAHPDEYLVAAGEQGTQPVTEPEGFRYVNPFEKRHHADQHPVAEVCDGG